MYNANRYCNYVFVSALNKYKQEHSAFPLNFTWNRDVNISYFKSTSLLNRLQTRSALVNFREVIRSYIVYFNFSTKFKLSKVNLSLCFFNWAPSHEGILREYMYSFIHSLTSAVDGGEWLVSCPGRFTPRERAPGIHCIGGWVGSRIGLDAVAKRKIPSPCRDSNPRSPSAKLLSYPGSYLNQKQ
jgi:hypothetical protein